MAIAISKIANPKRILAIKFSSIGDIVLAMSPIKSLKSIFPSARIDFLTLREFAPIIEGNKYIDTIIPFDRNGGFSDLIKTGKWINKSNYDIVIDFHNTLRSKIIRLVLNTVPVTYLKKPRWKRFLLFRFRRNNFSKDFSQLQLLHQPIKMWFTDEQYPLPELFISDSEKSRAKELLKKNGVTKQYITIIPGAAWYQKTWDSEKYCKLISDLRKNDNIDFVILGSKSDTICDDIAKCDSSIINMQGKTNLREAMAIITSSNYVIGADTGLVHAAEALGKNVVLILGPTSQETGAGINRDTSIQIENNDIWCRPCSQNGKRKCYRGKQYCMTSITPDIVYNKIMESRLF